MFSNMTCSEEFEFWSRRWCRDIDERPSDHFFLGHPVHLSCVTWSYCWYHTVRT